MVLSACSARSKPPQPPQIITEYKREQIKCPDAPRTRPLLLKDVVFVVATDDEGIKVLGLHESEYKKLAENTSNIKAFIATQKLVESYYIKCIRDFNDGG